LKNYIPTHIVYTQTLDGINSLLGLLKLSITSRHYIKLIKYALVKELQYKHKKYLALRKRSYATDSTSPLFLGVQPLIVSEVYVDQPTGKTGIPYDYDKQSMHNSVVEVTVQKRIVQTTMLDLQQNNNWFHEYTS